MKVGTVVQNLAALRAALFTLFGKKLMGGAYPPPPSVSWLKIANTETTQNVFLDTKKYQLLNSRVSVK